ncbi:alpha/beta fold hydrolase [Actinoplanes sp. NPDC023714]|uniref:alpha/beta fold hydrolase n=1 Tax=Actinoplanes sp. NPDC023714 TaxID=3154322 RepID=UPI0033F7D2AF
MNMHVVHDGSPHEPPLLLIHGSGASGASWAPIVPALAAHRHVIRVDLPGCGQSPPVGSATVPEQAGRVAALLDDLGLRRVAVAGHSSGGYVAVSLAEQRPDLVSRLALISTGPSLDAFLPEPPVLKLLLGPPLGRMLWALRSDAMIRRGITATAARPVDIPAAWVADMHGLQYRTFRTITRHATEFLRERAVPVRMKALDLKGLVIFGDADPRWDPASAHDYESTAGVRVEMLAGVGHLPMLEAPGETSRLLLAGTA